MHRGSQGGWGGALAGAGKRAILFSFFVLYFFALPMFSLRYWWFLVISSLIPHQLQSQYIILTSSQYRPQWQTRLHVPRTKSSTLRGLPWAPTKEGTVQRHFSYNRTLFVTKTATKHKTVEEWNGRNIYSRSITMIQFIGGCIHVGHRLFHVHRCRIDG